jgi:predicted PurR-regulated permease PerM
MPGPFDRGKPGTVQEKPSPFWWLGWVPAVVLAVLLLQLLYVAGRVAIVPVLASLALAYLLHPLVERFEARGLSRTVASLAALFVVALAGSVFLVFVIPDLWEEVVVAAQGLMSHFTEDSALRHRATLRRYAPFVDRVVGERFEQLLRDPASIIGLPSAWVAGALSGFLATAVASLDLLLVPFFIFYLLAGFSSWRSSVEDLIPPRFRGPFTRLFDEVGRILATYLRGQLFIAAIMAVLYAVGFAVLRVPAWAGLAALAGLLNVIPYVGTAFGFVLAAAFVLAHGGGLWKLVGLVAVFVAVQSAEGYYLTPRILGSRMSLHPMAVFLGLLIGGKLFGLLGIILAVPTVAIAKVFVAFAVELYKGSSFYGGENALPLATSSGERLADAADTVLANQAGAGDPAPASEISPVVTTQRRQAP